MEVAVQVRTRDGRAEVRRGDQRFTCMPDVKMQGNNPFLVYVESRETARVLREKDGRMVMHSGKRHTYLCNSYVVSSTGTIVSGWDDVFACGDFCVTHGSGQEYYLEMIHANSFLTQHFRLKYRPEFVCCTQHGDWVAVNGMRVTHGERLGEPQEFSSGYAILCVAMYGYTIALGHDALITLWAHGKLICSIPTGSPVRHMQFLPIGKLLFAVANTLVLWNYEKSKEVSRTPLDCDHIISFAAFPATPPVHAAMLMLTPPAGFASVLSVLPVELALASCCAATNSPTLPLSTHFERAERILQNGSVAI